MSLDSTRYGLRRAAARGSCDHQQQAGMRAVYGVTLVAALALIPTFAMAYVGPGLGLGAIASAFSLIGAVFLGILGFLWYPVKRLLKLFRKAKTSDE
jgi:hypothetical protein